MEIKTIILITLIVSSFTGAGFKFWNRQFLSDTILSLLLSTLGLLFLQAFLMVQFGADTTSDLIVLYSFLFYAFSLALAPLMYIYIRTILNDEALLSYKTINYLHFLPFLILLTFNVFSFFALRNIDVSSENYALTSNILNVVNFFAGVFFFFFQNMAYLFLSFDLLRKIKKNNIESIHKATLRWMNSFVAAYTLLIFLFYLNQTKIFNDIKIVFRVYSLLFVLFISYWGRLSYKFQQSKQGLLSPEKTKQLKDALISAMEKDRMFLDTGVTITDLAYHINSNTKYLSHVINNEYQTNFNGFVNKYRVQEAQSLLKNPENNIYTIESISKMTGFTSKTSFNYAFKKQTGTTPSIYRSKTH